MARKLVSRGASLLSAASMLVCAVGNGPIWTLSTRDPRDRIVRQFHCALTGPHLKHCIEVRNIGEAQVRISSRQHECDAAPCRRQICNVTVTCARPLLNCLSQHASHEAAGKH